MLVLPASAGRGSAPWGSRSGPQTGPYQFSFALTDPDKVEHFAFEDGLLVWMVDETCTDNNDSSHAGARPRAPRGRAAHGVHLR